MNFEVEANHTYFIEWDDRWSEEGFVFQFLFESASLFCENAAEMQSPITTNTAYHSENVLSYDGQVMNGAELVLTSGTGIELEAGFEIQSSSPLLLAIESCEAFMQRINN